jgi:hypothetical protein
VSAKAVNGEQVLELNTEPVSVRETSRDVPKAERDAVRVA